VRSGLLHLNPAKDEILNQGWATSKPDTGVDSMPEKSLLSRLATRITKILRTDVRMQSDGANIYIRPAAERYDIVVEDKQTGRIVTTFKELSPHSRQRLGTTHGWR
jgi:hypothetical protein